MLDVLALQPEHQAAVRAVWSRALAGEEFVEIAEFGDLARDRRSYEMRYNTLKTRDGRDLTVKLTDKTEYRNKDRQPAKLGDFKVGDSVFVRGEPSGDGQMTAEGVMQAPPGWSSLEPDQSSAPRVVLPLG